MTEDTPTQQGTPEIVLIVAVARNGVIGRDNGLPWKLRADLQHFRAVTMGHPILMGRKTWDSLGRPLPGRTNIVVSRSPDLTAKGAIVCSDIEAALSRAAAEGCERVFIVGGAEFYRQMLPRADCVMVTEVQAEVEGDAHFPPLDPQDFIEISRTHHSADAHNDHDFDFVEYRRR